MSGYDMNHMIPFWNMESKNIIIMSNMNFYQMICREDRTGGIVLYLHTRHHVTTTMISGRHPSEAVAWQPGIQSFIRHPLPASLPRTPPYPLSVQLCYDAMICLLSGALMIHLTFSFS